MSNSELIGGNAESMELRNSVSFSKLVKLCKYLNLYIK